MTPQLSTQILTVSELTGAIKSLLELQYRFVHIRGEISNLRIPYSGHAYFTLKDSGAQIRAVLFKGQQRYLRRRLEEGLSVVCHGRISVYEPRGEYQIIVDTLDFSGAGDLQLEFERLKRKLADEGLFDVSKKRALPAYPEHIVLITSPTGAAVRDFLEVARARGYSGRISILPVSVQGKRAAAEIAEALETACRATAAELVILIRGGGSLEDLWPFNEELTARAISRATLPVVTGVGHQTDTTIADLCADYAAHTPTAAAEATIADSASLIVLINELQQRMAGNLRRRLDEREAKVNSLRRIMGDLGLFLDNSQLRLDHLVAALVQALKTTLFSCQARLDQVGDRLSRQSPGHRIELRQQRLAGLRAELERTIAALLERKETHLARQAAVLDSVSPLAVLARGYSIVSTRRGARQEIVSRADQVDQGDRVEVKLHRGELFCEVKKTSGE